MYLTNGYIDVYYPTHAHARPNGSVHQHVLVAEVALGYLLPKGVEVHHVNTDRTDNRGPNLVICQDHKYHTLLHQRMRAFKACGNPNYRKCTYCKKWGSVTELRISEPTVYHLECHTRHMRKYRDDNREAYRLYTRKRAAKKRAGTMSKGAIDDHTDTRADMANDHGRYPRRSGREPETPERIDGHSVPCPRALREFSLA